MRIRTILAAAAAPAALAAALLGSASGASAAATAGPAPGHYLTHERFAGQIRQVPSSVIPHPHRPGNLVRHGSALTSNNWSGYALQACATCHLRYVESDFTLPSVNPADAAGTSDVFWASHWVGLDGLTTGSVEQTGVDAAVENGTVVYYAWYEMFPADPVVFQLAAQPGDNIDVAVYYNQADHLWTLSLNDTTQGVGVSTNQAAPAGVSPANTSAEVISEDPGGAVPGGYHLADFGQANYSGSRVTTYNGTRGGLASSSLWTSYPVTMRTNSTSPVMASPGALYAGSSGGIPVSAFSEFWHSDS